MARRHPGIGAISVPPFDAVADPRKYVWIKDDFVSGLTTTGNVGDLGWQFAGTGATVGTYGGDGAHPGTITLTAATSGFSADLALQQDIVDFDNLSDSLYAMWVFQTPGALTNQEIRFGFADELAVGADRPDEGIWLEYDAAVDADDWQFVSDDTVTTTVQTAASWIAAPAVSTWYCLEMAVTSTSVMAWLDGQPLWDGKEITTVPTGGLTPYAHAGNGANGGTVVIDAFAMRLPVNRSGMALV
jgi:hypothetical protein